MLYTKPARIVAFSEQVGISAHCLTALTPVFLGLDVFVTEPVTAETYGSTLFTLDNVVVQPHTGASTIEVTRESTISAIDTAYNYCIGKGFAKSTLVREIKPTDLSRRP